MIVYATELRLFVGWRIEGISYENAYYKILFIVLWVKDYQRAFHIVLFHLFCSPPQYRSALVATRMRNIVFILLLIGLPLGRCPSGLWRKSYVRHWHLMNDHSDRGYRL